MSKPKTVWVKEFPEDTKLTARIATVDVKMTRRLRFRIWLASQLVMLAGLVMGIETEVETGVKEGENG